MVAAESRTPSCCVTGARSDCSLTGSTCSGEMATWRPLHLVSAYLLRPVTRSCWLATSALPQSGHPVATSWLMGTSYNPRRAAYGSTVTGSDGCLVTSSDYQVRELGDFTVRDTPNTFPQAKADSKPQPLGTQGRETIHDPCTQRGTDKQPGRNPGGCGGI